MQDKRVCDHSCDQLPSPKLPPVTVQRPHRRNAMSLADNIQSCHIRLLDTGRIVRFILTFHHGIRVAGRIRPAELPIKVVDEPSAHSPLSLSAAGYSWYDTIDQRNKTKNQPYLPSKTGSSAENKRNSSRPGPFESAHGMGREIE